MRRVILIVSVLVDLVGMIWLLQGLNILGGSRMTGDPFWAVMGCIVLVIGTAVFTFTLARRAAARRL